jgi:hypothetical protein
MHFFIVVQSEGTFTFTALWGEQMVARPSDAIDRNPADPTDAQSLLERLRAIADRLAVHWDEASS